MCVKKRSLCTLGSAILVEEKRNLNFSNLVQYALHQEVEIFLDSKINKACVCGNHYSRLRRKELKYRVDVISSNF